MPLLMDIDIPLALRASGLNNEMFSVSHFSQSFHLSMLFIFIDFIEDAYAIFHFWHYAMPTSPDADAAATPLTFFILPLRRSRRRRIFFIVDAAIFFAIDMRYHHAYYYAITRCVPPPLRLPSCYLIDIDITVCVLCWLLVTVFAISSLRNIIGHLSYWCTIFMPLGW